MSVEDALPLLRLTPFAELRSSPEEVTWENPLDGVKSPLVETFACGPPLTARLNIFLHR